jgi:hypothetical protein
MIKSTLRRLVGDNAASLVVGTVGHRHSAAMKKGKTP